MRNHYMNERKSYILEVGLKGFTHQMIWGVEGKRKRKQ